MFSLNSVGRITAAVVACVVAAGIFFSGPVRAQSFVLPPAISSVDGNGVDLASGKFTLPSLNVAIGGSGSGLSRIAGVNGSDNEVGKMVQDPVQLGTLGSGGTIMFMDVSYGGKTDRFWITYSPQGQGSDTTNRSPYYFGGDQLSCDNIGTSIFYPSGTCYLTRTDGTVVTYTRAASGSVEWGTLTGVTKPDGEVLTYTYYMSGSSTKAIKSVSSSLGWMLKYEVDGNYKITKITGINTSVAYCDPQASSCAVSSSFPYGTQTTNGTTTTIAQNGSTVVTYTISGNVVTLTSPNNVTKTVTYSGTDTTGRVASVSTGGSTWNYTYTLDGNGKISQAVVTAPNQTTTKQNFGTGGMVSSTDEAGRVSTYSRFSDTSSFLYGSLAAVAAPDGNLMTGGYTSYSYDSRGNVAAVTVVPKGGATNGVPNAGAAMVTQNHYPTCDYSPTGNYKYCNKPDYVIDSNGVRTDYVYDGNHGGVLKVTKPAVNGVAPQIRYSYSQITPHRYTAPGVMSAQAPVWRLTSTSTCMTGQSPACVGGTDEHKTTISYGSDNANPAYNNVFPVSQTESLGDGALPQTTTQTYDVNGNITSLDGPKPGAVDTGYKFYDTRGRVIGTIGIDPDAGGLRNRPATRTIYDADGQVSEVDTGTASGTDATALTNMVVQERDTNAFNSAGLPAVAKHFIGNSATPKDVTQRSYDNMLRLSCEAVRLNSVDYNALPTSACTLGTTNGGGSHDRITQYNYDPVTGVLISTVSGYGTNVARTDSLKVFDASGATSTGTLTYVEDAKGNRTSYFYDAFDRLTKTCYPLSASVHTSSTTDCEQTIYRTTTVTGTSQATSLVNTVILRDNTVINFGYDTLARTASKSAGVNESFTYDNFGQIRTHTNNTTGGNAVTETYIYNAMGWQTSDAQPMGTVTYGYDVYGKRNQMTYPGGGLYVTYAYNDADELIGIFENGSVQIAGFAYDDYGRRTTLSRGNGVPTGYGFDSSLRLGSITQGTGGAGYFNQVSYGYTPADQIASKTATNSNYNYTTAAKTLGYTIDGLNRVSAIGGTNMAYDTRGNMTGDGGGTYVYNANNLLTSATQSGITSTLTYDAENRLLSVAKNGTTTQFLYDGTDIIAEYNGSGGLIRRYVHGPSEDEPLVWYEGAGTGTKYYYGADDQGSVTIITNGSGGQYAIDTYDEYGVPGAGNTGRFQYTGQIWLPEIGMYYYKARLYNPAIGRFMQTDPIGYGDGMNWYAYVHGDPIGGTDSSGLDDDSDGDTVTASASCTGTNVLGSRCDPTVVVVKGKKKSKGESRGILYWSHWVLGVGTFCPSICGSVFGYADAGVYLYQGRNVDAALSAGAATFGLFSDAGAVKAAEEGGKLAFKAIGSTGKVGEKALKGLGGVSQKFFRTSTGGRFVDQFVNGAAHESKVGYTTLTKSVERQIAKDVELIQTGEIKGSTWHFFTSPVTGLGGASQPLIDALKNAGIGVVVH